MMFNMVLAAWAIPGWVKDGAKKVLEIPRKVADSVVMEFVKSMYNGVINMMQQFMTSFLDITPGVDLNGDAMTWMTTATGPITFVLTTIGLTIAGIRAMYHARGQDIRVALEGLGRLVFVVTAGNVLMSVMIPATDVGAKWIVSLADADFNKYNMPNAGTLVSSLGGSLFLFSALSGLILFIQWGLMIIRAVMLPLLVAFWPVAEASNLMQGEVKFSKLTRWIIAFLAFKPVVATIYGFSFILMQGSDGVAGALSGMATIAISIMAMPAILALVMPQAGGAGASMGGKETMTAVGMAAGAAAMIGTGGAAGAAGAGAGAAGGGGAAAGGGGAAGAGAAGGGSAGGGASGAGGSFTGSSPGADQATDVGSGPTLDQTGWDSSSAEGGSAGSGPGEGDTQQMPTLDGQDSPDAAGAPETTGTGGSPTGSGSAGSPGTGQEPGVSDTQGPSSPLGSPEEQGTSPAGSAGGETAADASLDGVGSGSAEALAGGSESGSGGSHMPDVLRLAEQAAHRRPDVEEMFLDEKRLDS